MDFLKKSKFAMNLVQPIRDYISIVYEGYMKTLRLINWRLDDLLSLNNKDFADDIKTLPLHFKFHPWKLFYNDGKELGRDSKKEILDVIACPQMSGEIPRRKNSQTKKTTSAQVKLPLSNTPCGQKPPHMAKQMIAFIPQTPQKD